MRVNIRKIFNSNITLRNGMLFALFSFFNNGISFILLIILANYIPPEGYGELSLFNTLVILLSILISLNSTGVISVNFFRESKTYLLKTINTVLFISTTVLFILASIILIFSNLSQIIIGISLEYQWISLFICYFQVFSSINLDIWRLEEKPIPYGFYSIFSVLVNFILTLLFVIGLSSGWQGRVYAQIITGLCFFIISILFLYRRGYITTIRPDKKSFKDALNFGIPLIPHAASGWIRQGLDRYLINFFHTSYSVGLFSFAYNLSNVISIIGNAFNASNSVYIYKELSDNKSNTRVILTNQTKMMVLIFAIVTFFLAFIFVMITPFVFPKYSESVKYIMPLCISAFFQCIYYLFVNYLFYFKRTKNLMYITFSLSIFHFILSFFLTRISIYYTVYITLFINLLTALIIFLYSRKLYKLF